MAAMSHWPLRQLGETDIPVGACAWHIGLLAEEHTADHVHARPSLVVALPKDDDALLQAAAPRLGALPVMLVVAEPTFARRLADNIRSRMASLGVSHVAALALAVEDPADLKSGGMLQVLFDLRQAGVCDHLGLAQADARHAEWIARHTAVRLLLTEYSLHNQQTAWRTLAAAEEFGMACIALSPPPQDDERALRFALGSHERVLPLLDRPLPEGVEPMLPAELTACWEAYQRDHKEPAPLLRSQPPE